MVTYLVNETIEKPSDSIKTIKTSSWFIPFPSSHVQAVYCGGKLDIIEMKL